MEPGAGGSWQFSRPYRHLLVRRSEAKSSCQPAADLIPRLVLASGEKSGYYKMFKLLGWKLSGVLEICKDRNDSDAASKRNF